MAHDKKTFKVTGMHCDGCANTVSRLLGKVEGVESADVSLEKGEAEVSYDSTSVTFDQLKHSVEKAGYGLENA